VGGGRNAAFAVWATAVGVAYGALAVTLADGSAPMLAHAAANAAGALLWRAANEDKVAAAQGGAAQAAAAAPAAQAPASRAAPDRPAWWREGDD
jgi:microcystin-dependent protein